MSDNEPTTLYFPRKTIVRQSLAIGIVFTVIGLVAESAILHARVRLITPQVLAGLLLLAGIASLMRWFKLQRLGVEVGELGLRNLKRGDELLSWDRVSNLQDHPYSGYVAISGSRLDPTVTLSYTLDRLPDAITTVLKRSPSLAEDGDYRTEFPLSQAFVWVLAAASAFGTLIFALICTWFHYHPSANTRFNRLLPVIWATFVPGYLAVLYNLYNLPTRLSILDQVLSIQYRWKRPTTIEFSDITDVAMASASSIRLIHAGKTTVLLPGAGATTLFTTLRRAIPTKRPTSP